MRTGQRIGYVRDDGIGDSADVQERALTDAGVHRLVREDAEPGDRRKRTLPPQLAGAIRTMKQGDDLVVLSFDRLGRDRETLKLAVMQLGKRGARVVDLKAKETINCHPGAEVILDALERAKPRIYSEITGRMRAEKDALGEDARGGGQLRWSDDDYEQAKPFYFDVRLTVPEVEEKTGMPYRTLHRYFGDAGRRTAAKDERGMKGRSGRKKGSKNKPKSPQPRRRRAAAAASQAAEG